MNLNRRTALTSLAALTLSPVLPRLVQAQPTPAPRPVPGGDRIAMLLYAGMTALDLVGPYHFLASMPGASVDLVTTGPDLSPVTSDLGLALQPTATLDTCPEDLTLLFVPGGTMGTLAAARDPATIAFIRDRASRAPATSPASARARSSWAPRACSGASARPRTGSPAIF